jgi:POT family proton-dependent oligopeptide transporter
MAGQSLTPVIFVFLIYLLHTMAELCFSPVGLSAMTRLSVSNMVGLVMGTWFLAMAAGNFIAGLIARATGSGEAGDVTQVLDVYSRIGWFSVVVGGLVLLVSPYVKRMMHLDLIAAEKGKQA